MMELTDSEVAFYQREGYLPLPGFLAESLVGAVRAEVFEVLAANGFPRSALDRATTSADSCASARNTSRARHSMP